MAQKTVIILEDDTDGSKASETVTFGLDGATYEIDLSDKNAGALRKALGPWLNAARRTGGRRGGSTTKATKSDLIDTKAVRAWAASNGISVSSRGRIPADVITQYQAAGH